MKQPVIAALLWAAAGAALAAVMASAKLVYGRVGWAAMPCALRPICITGISSLSL